MKPGASCLIGWEQASKVGGTEHTDGTGRLVHHVTNMSILVDAQTPDTQMDADSPNVQVAAAGKDNISSPQISFKRADELVGNKNSLQQRTRKLSNVGKAGSTVVRSCWVDETTPFFGATVAIVVASAASIKCISTRTWLTIPKVDTQGIVEQDALYVLEGTSMAITATGSAFVCFAWLLSMIRIFKPRRRDGSHYPIWAYYTKLLLCLAALGLFIAELVRFWTSPAAQQLQAALEAAGYAEEAVYVSPGAINCLISAVSTGVALLFMMWDCFYKWPDMSTSEPRRRLCVSLSLLNLLFLFTAAVFYWIDGWPYTSCYVFTVNAATTIGLTTLYPESLGAEIAFYLLSPLGLLAVAIMSIALKDVLVEHVGIVYRHRYASRTERKDHEAHLARIQLGILVLVWLVYWFVGAWFFYLAERGKWSYRDSLSFAYNSLTTMGMTTLQPTNPLSWELFVFYVMFEVSIFAFILSTLQEVANDTMRKWNHQMHARERELTLEFEGTRSMFDSKTADG